MKLIGRFTTWAQKRRDNLIMAFIAVNYLLMSLDCTLVHWSAGFDHLGMYLAAGWPLLAALPFIFFTFKPMKKTGRGVAIGISLASVAVGIAGLAWHLLGQFFVSPSLTSLIYSAPILAPLGLTVLAIMTLAIIYPPPEGLTRRLIGFMAFWMLGLMLLSLQDHAQNNFYEWGEWIPIIVGVFAMVVFGLYATFYKKMKNGNGLILTTTLALFITAAVGAVMHLVAFFEATVPLVQKLSQAAPPLAPTLFGDAAVFVLIALLYKNNGKEKPAIEA
ncbi:hypothetical protein K8R78_03010 [bacterium]|nr:hypothetical protein [bacterium]